MRYLLDTNTCIQFLNGRNRSVPERLRQVRRGDVVLCSVVKAELLFGAFKSQRREQTIAKIEQFVQDFASLPFDDSAALHYGRIKAHLQKSGRIIGPNDLMIAAIAVANDLVLVTHNRREFERVPGLVIEDWEE